VGRGAAWRRTPVIAIVYLKFPLVPATPWDTARGCPPRAKPEAKDSHGPPRPCVFFGVRHKSGPPGVPPHPRPGASGGKQMSLSKKNRFIRKRPSMLLHEVLPIAVFFPSARLVHG